MKSNLDSATQSRLANLRRKLGGGKQNVYAISDRNGDMTILVVHSCSEEAVRLIREEFGLDWTLGNTNSRAVQRNVDADPEIITAFKINHGRTRAEMKLLIK